MNLPAYIRTKAEAKKLTEDLFPGAKAALARIKPGTSHPRYQVDQDVFETLRAVFTWLHERKPKLYQRARWHLFYDLAHRVVRQIDENAQAKVHDLIDPARLALTPMKKSPAAVTPVPPPADPAVLTAADGTRPSNGYLWPTEDWKMEGPWQYGHDSRTWIGVVALSDGRFSIDGHDYAIQKNLTCYGQPCVYATRAQAIRVSAARAIRHMRHARNWNGIYELGFADPERLEYALNWALATAYRETAAPRPPRPVRLPRPAGAAPCDLPRQGAAAADLPTTDGAGEPSVLQLDAADPWSQF